MCSRLGVQHRLRAPEAHVDAIELLEHKHVMGAARAAIAAARGGATARDWEDAALVIWIWKTWCSRKNAA